MLQNVKQTPGNSRSQQPDSRDSCAVGAAALSQPAVQHLTPQYTFQSELNPTARCLLKRTDHKIQPFQLSISTQFNGLVSCSSSLTRQEGNGIKVISQNYFSDRAESPHVPPLKMLL